MNDAVPVVGDEREGEDGVGRVLGAGFQEREDAGGERRGEGERPVERVWDRERGFAERCAEA